MRIFLIWLQSPHRHPLPAYAFWRGYLLPGLAEAGHEVIEPRPDTDWAGGLLPLNRAERRAWLDRVWTSTLEDIRRARAAGGIDLVLTYLYPSQIDRSAIREIRRASVPVVNFFCDNIRQFTRLPAAFSAFDAHWVPEAAALPLYAARGWRACFAPMPCWVPPERRHTPAERSSVARFIGRGDRLRIRLLAHLRDAELPLEIYGQAWGPGEGASAPRATPALAARLADWSDLARRQGLAAVWHRLRSRAREDAPAPDLSRCLRGAAPDDAYAELLAGCAVTLGINRFPKWGPAGGDLGVYSRLRDIEAPMLGACYLTEHTPELERFYDCDQEIATYRNEAELVEKTRHLLASPDRRHSLRVAAQRRALADHTIERSIGTIAQSLGL